MKRMLPAIATAAAIAAAAPSFAQSSLNIGLASAAKNEVIVVGETTKGLKAGDTIFQNQHIRTGRDSAAQLLFRDETALTMGPNASLVLDKAVYDPAKHTSEITVRAVSGAFRFVSGSSPTGSYSINTPSGTVGIRGTWIEMLIEGGVTRIIVRRGLVQFCNVASQCTRVLPGYEIRAMRDRISPPAKVSHETVESVVALWFKEGENAGQLAPSAGPGDAGTGGPEHAGKSFWWLDGASRGPDFQPQKAALTATKSPSGVVVPPDPNPPPQGPNPNRLQRKALKFLFRVVHHLYHYIDVKTHNRWQVRKVKWKIRDEARDLKQYVRTTLPTIATRDDLRNFRNEVRDQARDIKKEVRRAVRHHHHHHYKFHNHHRRRGPGGKD